MNRLPITAVALGILALSHSAAHAQPLFAGDPVDPVTGKAYCILPGLPLVYPGPDGLYGTTDDVIDDSIVGDVDIVLRTGGGFAGGAIPLNAAGVANAPVVVAGGLHGRAGTLVPFQIIATDGALLPVGGHALLGPELDARRALVVLYADLDGDGFIGPTATVNPNDVQVQRQEALTLAGRAMAEIHGGVASGLIGTFLGAPASMGGLGIVAAAGAATGATPNLYDDGPWAATSLPYMIPLDQSRIVGGEATGPIDPVGLVDLELSGSAIFLPSATHPVLGGEYAIPLDGSDVSVDLMRSNAGAAVGAGFAQPIDRQTFVAAWGRVIRPAVDQAGNRSLVELVDSLSLPADGSGNEQTVLVFPTDVVGNPTDPPAGGLAIALEVGPELRIAAPDTDGDPRRETLVFNSPGYRSLVIDDAGIARSAAVTSRLLAVRGGVPTGLLTFNVTPGAGGGVAPLGAVRAHLRHSKKAGRDSIELLGIWPGSPLSLDPASQGVVLSVSGPAGMIYQRTFPAASFAAVGSGRKFVFKDATTRGTITRKRRDPQTMVLHYSAKKLDLSAVAPSLGSVEVALTIGDTSAQAALTCIANTKGTVSSCAP